MVTMTFDISTKRLLSAFFAEDDVGAIIRCHVDWMTDTLVGAAETLSRSFEW